MDWSVVIRQILHKKPVFKQILLLLILFNTDLARSLELQRGSIYASTGVFAYGTLGKSGINNEHSAIHGSAALLVEGGLDPSATLEIGLFPINKAYIRVFDNNEWVSYTAQKMHITTSYRYYFWDVFSIAMGIGTSYSMGDPHIRGYSSPAGRELLDLEKANKGAIYNLDTSFQWIFWGEKRWHGLIDLRTDLDFSRNPNAQSDHATILIGVKYHVENPKRND